MNTLRVTPEMRQRTLDALTARRAAELRRRRRRTYAGAASLAACLVLALLLGHLLPRTPDDAPIDPVVMSPYGATECADVRALSAALGFPVKAPSELPFVPETITYSAMFGEFAQIDYAGAGFSVCARMEPGSADVSGDYNEYPLEETVDMNGQRVLLKGDGSAVSLATWTDGEYAYSLAAEPAIARDAMLRMAESLH